jgi:GNAT superfamily N-acetyltransferase
MTWVIREPTIHQLNRVRKFLEAEIVGVSARRAVETEDFLRREAKSLLPVGGDEVLTTSWHCAYLSDGSLVGAVLTNVPEETVDVAELFGDRYAQGFARTRRTLASIAVRGDMRGHGIGRALLDVAEAQARAEGAIHLTGFMDERNGAPVFYSKNGYTVQPRNTALPQLEPFPIRERHPNDLSGCWFYKPL